MKTRRRARRVTLEVLYEYDIARHLPGEILQRRLEANSMDSAGAEFASHLVQGVMQNLDGMDILIARYAPEWPLDQMAVIDRNILRIAIYEFIASEETPVKVAINEAVELAKTYGSDSAPRFINGVLGTLAEQIPELRSELSMHQEELVLAPE
ncbi:MAG: transcription antitermination factor NusB [Candidatus Promineifilaceae bacterium]|jgi:transcription antitermination protein NusB